MNNEDMRKIVARYSRGKLTRSQGIKIYCRYICCCNDVKFWKECTFTDCPLYRFRTGREGKSSQTKKQVEKQAVLHIKNSRELKGEGESE